MEDKKCAYLDDSFDDYEMDDFYDGDYCCKKESSCDCVETRRVPQPKCKKDIPDDCKYIIVAQGTFEDEGPDGKKPKKDKEKGKDDKQKDSKDGGEDKSKDKDKDKDDCDCSCSSSSKDDSKSGEKDREKQKEERQARYERNKDKDKDKDKNSKEEKKEEKHEPHKGEMYFELKIAKGCDEYFGTLLFVHFMKRTAVCANELVSFQSVGDTAVALFKVSDSEDGMKEYFISVSIKSDGKHDPGIVYIHTAPLEVEGYDWGGHLTTGYVDFYLL